MLAIYTDGIAAHDLGVIGERQYAVGAATVWARAAWAVGTYGGWRWECDRHFPANNKGAGIYGELATRIDAVDAIR